MTKAVLKSPLDLNHGNNIFISPPDSRRTDVPLANMPTTIGSEPSEDNRVYPNIGKNTLLNLLSQKRVCQTATSTICMKILFKTPLTEKVYQTATNNMQLSSMYLSLGVLSVLFTSTAAITGYTATYIFNNGVSTAQVTCSGAEWATIQAAVEKAAASNRRLSEHSRRLGCKCPGSAQACAYIGCPPKRRRRLGAVAGGQTQQRNLNQCAADIEAIDAALVTLTVSPLCRNLLNAPRTIGCEYITTDCYITKVSLWNAASNVMIVDSFNSTGGTVCKNQKVTFRAHASFDIGNVNFVANGPGGFVSNHTETKEPYYMHGNAGTNVNGVIFPKGNYNLTITSQFNTAQRVIQFTSIDC